MVFRSLVLPIILVAVIEFAIFVNMSIPFYTHTSIPFIASIVIGTIQLGATVDYAILMTNNYKSARAAGMEKKGCGAACSGIFRPVYCSQCVELFRIYIWCWYLFQHRYDQFAVYSDGSGSPDQYGSSLFLYCRRCIWYLTR